MAQGDAIKIFERERSARPGESAGHGESFFGRDGRDGEGADVEEDHDGRCGLELLQKVDEHRGGGFGTAGLVEEDAHALDR